MALKNFSDVMVSVKFTKNFSGYPAGSVSEFPELIAVELIDAGLAHVDGHDEHTNGSSNEQNNQS